MGEENVGKTFLRPQRSALMLYLLFIITPIMLTKDVLLYLGEKRLVG